MISTRDLDSLQRSTIFDSLMDMSESYDTAYWQTKEDYYMDMANAIANAANAFEAGAEITEDERGMAIDALEASHYNCVDLGLVAEANEYRDAAIAVRSL